MAKSKNRHIRSVHINSRSGKRERIAPHRVNRKSSQRRIKQHRNRAKEGQVLSHDAQTKHLEIEWNDKVYNCATSCDVIDIVTEECSNGLFAALCVKCALCLKDLANRVAENTHRRTDDEIQADERALYEHSTLSPDGHWVVLPNRKHRMVFVDLNDFVEWRFIEDAITQVPVDKLFQIYVEKIRDSFDMYLSAIGLWIQMNSLVRVIDVPVAKQLSQTLNAGLNKYNGTTTVELRADAMIGPSWQTPLQRVASCLQHVIRAYKTCGITDEDLNIVKEIVCEIFDSQQRGVNWSRLADTFMGGLYDFSHNESVVASELAALEKLHYLRDFPRVRQTLRAYISGLG